MEDYIQTYEKFWKDIIEKDGVVSKDQIMRELHDYNTLLENVPKVYMHITGHRISKPNTDPDVVIAEADECYEKLYSEDDETESDLPTRLRELVQNVRDIDMKIKKRGHYVNSGLVNRYTCRLLQIANELEKEG